MTYKVIRNLITAEAEESKKRTANYLQSGEWKEYSNLNRFLTPAKLRAYKAGTITEAEAITEAIKRNGKQVDKYTAKQMQKLEEIAEAGKATEIRVNVEWKRNRTWGHNPTATVLVYSETANGMNVEEFTGTASGCGYDKESAAVASALNSSLAVRKAMTDAKEKAEGKEIFFGSNYLPIPFIDTGIGMSTVTNILAVCGLEKDYETHGKAFDTYSYSRKEK